MVFDIGLGRLTTRQLLPAPRNGMQVVPVPASVGCTFGRFIRDLRMRDGIKMLDLF